MTHARNIRRLKHNAKYMLIWSARKIAPGTQDNLRDEFENYKMIMTRAVESGFSGKTRIIFDLAEKELLSHTHRQPGQIHVITGLKFDLFGVTTSNLGRK